MPARRLGRTSASSARIPPSPWLSARVSTRTYFSVTTSISDQKNSESSPSTSSCVAWMPVEWWKHSRRA